MFPSEFCEISKNIFFTKTPPVAASEHLLKVTAVKRGTHLG